MNFIPLPLKKRMTECCSLVNVISGAAIFTLLRHRTTTCRLLFKPSVSFLSTYKTVKLCFEFLSHF